MSDKDPRDPVGRVKIYNILGAWLSSYRADDSTGQVLRILVRWMQRGLVAEMSQEERVYMVEGCDAD